MTTRYDAWSELPAPVAEALRSSLYSGDWSAWDPEAVDAFRQAFNDDDWSGFDPQTAIAIRAAVGQEQIAGEAAARQERLEANVNLDREMAAEMRELSAKYIDFHANAAEILEYGVKSNLTDLDQAYKAWRSSKGHDGPALAQTVEPHPIAGMETQLNELNARLAKLNLGDLRANDAEIRQVERDRGDLQDAIALAILRAAGDPDRDRRDLLHTANAERARDNSERATRREYGHVDASRRQKPREELDLEALDIVQGRVSIESLARANEPEVSTPNAEAVMQDAAENA